MKHYEDEQAPKLYRILSREAISDGVFKRCLPYYFRYDIQQAVTHRGVIPSTPLPELKVKGK